jgi:hypothetical protein
VSRGQGKHPEIQENYVNMTIFMVSVLNQCESMCIMILVGQILVFGGHQNDWQIARLKQDCNFELLPATTFLECSVFDGLSGWNW